MTIAEKVVCGIDPGVNTGLAVVRVSTDEFGRVTFVLLEQAELLWPESVYRILKVPADFYVLEDFILRAEQARGVAANDPRLTTVRVIGALQISLPREKLFFQRNVDKPACSDEYLRELGLYSSSPHIRDALRHVVIFVLRNIDLIRKHEK